jgi:peptidoglycan hydrolase CwlO-like protein
MKRWIIFSIVMIALAACGTKKAEEAQLTEAEEIQMVDSASMETKARVDDISKSVDDLQNEVDSLLNEINKK